MDNSLLRIAIYPYDYEMQPYLRYSSMLKSVKPVILLTPNGWASENEQLYGYKVQTVLSNDDFQSLDAIWITDSVNNVQDKQIYEIVEEFLKHNKQILLSRHIQKETYDDLVQLVNKYSGKLVNLLQNEQYINFNTIPAKLYDIYTPIIDIAGIGEKTDKFFYS